MMARRPSFESLRTPAERTAYQRAADVDTYVRKMAQGKVPVLSRSDLARQFQTTTRSVEKFLGSAVRREGAIWVPEEPGGFVKEMSVITEDGVVRGVPIRNFGDRSIVAKHHAAASALSEHGNPGPLRRLRRVTIVDANGRRYRLADEREVRRMIRAGDLQGVQPY